MVSTESGRPSSDDAASEDVETVREQQHTGNHDRGERSKGKPYGADTFGGTRAGAENVEPTGADKAPGPTK